MDDFTNAFRGGYRRRAFFVQYNVILLLGAAAFSAASASFVPLAVGGALELAWLVSAPWFSSFRRWVDSRRAEGGALTGVDSPRDEAALAVTAPPVSPVRRGSRLAPSGRGSVPAGAGAPPAYPPRTGSVDGEYAERAKRLGASIREIFLLAEEELRNGNEELAAALATLPELSVAFERLCKLHQRLSRFVAQSSKADLEREVERLTDEFSKETDLGLRTTLRQALILAQRRLEQHGRICSLYRATELRLDMIDGAAAHVRSRGLTMASPEEFAAEIRGLLTHVSQVNALEHDSAEAPASRRTGAATSVPDVAVDG